VSGTQGGQDGRGDTPLGAVSFEAKLYRSKLSKTAVNNKAFEITASPNPPDLWVLAATVGVSTQIKETLEAGLARTEITPLVLDWPSNDPLPPLPLLCAMAPGALTAFFDVHAPGQHLGMASDLSLIGTVAGFTGRSTALRRALTDEMLAAPLALAANRARYRAWFAARPAAMQRFGQPLAPAGQFALATIDRPGRARLDAVLAAPPGKELMVVSGGQGSGKSWSVAQAWLAQAEAPYLVFLTADEAVAAMNCDAASLVARSLIEHSGSMVTEMRLERWAHRLKAWEKAPVSRPRLVVVVDGLNERPRADWGLWLSRLSGYLTSIGGIVIATSRARFLSQIEDRFAVALRKIAIEDFTAAELDAVLARHQIDPAVVAGPVKRSLRNPRILGIALELLGNGQILAAEELSIERLLFEHLRSHQTGASPAETPRGFARVLADHARAVRERITQQVTADQLVFDSYDAASVPAPDLPRDLLPVMQERFFDSVEGDPTLYRLTEEGLVYGLGIATIRELQAALRVGRAVAERLAEVIEPIAALDMVSEVLFAAAILASVDDVIEQPIAAALMARYAAQQNIAAEAYPAFRGIVRNRPEAALDALFLIDTGDGHASHKDWLVAALRHARSDSRAWSAIAGRIDGWLRIGSLDPRPALHFAGDDAAKRQEKIDAQQVKIDQRLADMTACERTFFHTKISRDDAIDPVALSEDAFLILAGMPLMPFAEALAAWSFAQSLNSSYRTPWREYRFVVQHNGRDWFETRAALLAAVECFARDDASKTARWALVAVLRATGDADDGDRAEALAETLTEDWQRIEGWRQVERYCASDPCDPASERPDNVGETARRYAALPPAALMRERHTGTDDHFLHDAAPAVARFEPQAGVSLTRALLREVLARPGKSAQLALGWLPVASVLIEPAMIGQVVERVKELSHPGEPEGVAQDDDWAVSQYWLVSALAHLDGDAQVAVLRELPPHGPPLLQLEEVFRLASASAVDGLIESALQGSDESRLVMALAFARGSRSPLSESALSRVRALIDHPKRAVRGISMQISAEHPDTDQLERFVASGWTAAALDAREDFYERWHGSSLILAAAQQQLLDPAEAIARIVPERYSDAAQTLGSDRSGEAIAGLVTAASGRVLGANLPFRPPQVSRSALPAADGIARLSLDEDDAALDMLARIERMNESDEAFAERQRAGWDRFHAFEAALTENGAHLILQDIGVAAVQAMGRQAPTALDTLANEILALPPKRLPRLVNLASRLARALANIDPDKAVALYQRIADSEGYVRITRTVGEIPLQAWDAWHSAASEPMHSYWCERLERAATDQALASEALAAACAGRQSFIEDWAQAEIASGHPIGTARALTVLGFCDTSSRAETLLETFRNRKGFVGEAAQHAGKAYERNRWSRHWYGELVRADDPAEFWRYATLLGKIVDMRIELWRQPATDNSLLDRFAWALDKSVAKRIGTWAKKRSDKLFGGHRPRAIYLERSP
jgi:hypothetical protein